MAPQKAKRRYGQAIRLRIMRIYEYVNKRIAAKFQNTNVSAALALAHLEYGIIILHILSGILYITCQSYPGFMHIRMFVRRSNCQNNTECGHALEELAFRPTEIRSGYRSMMRVFERAKQMLPPYVVEDREIQLLESGIRMDLFIQLSIWPLEPTCMVILFAVDGMRQFFRNRLQKRDATVMFSMLALMLSLCILRAFGIHMYFSVLHQVNDMAQKINYRSSVDNVLPKMPIVLCVEPPSSYFLLSLLNFFITLVQMTFVLDYLDPN